jgi:glycosyltransferase involved in cell wall biosynthesis
VAELVSDKVDGLLCPPGDHEAVAWKLEQLYHDAELTATLVEAARKKAAGAWAPERYVREIETAMTDAAGVDR